LLDFWFAGRYPGNAKGDAGGVCFPQGGPVGGVLGSPPVTSALPTPAGPVGPPGIPDYPPPAPIKDTPLRPAPW
jgi:hypothetical protein